jgi:hypothetical protein
MKINRSTTPPFEQRKPLAVKEKRDNPEARLLCDRNFLDIWYWKVCANHTTLVQQLRNSEYVKKYYLIVAQCLGNLAKKVDQGLLGPTVFPTTNEERYMLLYKNGGI